MATIRSRERKQAKWRGKNTEYSCAKAMHGTVVGRSKVVQVGEDYVTVSCQRPPDVIAAGGFSFECKNTRFPKAVSKALSQAERNAPAGFDGFVWWYDSDTDSTYIVMSKRVFLDRLGSVASEEPEGGEG